MANVFRTEDFSGGMNDWLHPGLLPANTAAELVNAELSDGKLSPIRSPLKMSYDTPEQYGHHGNPDRSVVKWYNRYYWSNDTALQAPYYGGDPEDYLGMPYPAYSGTGQNVTVAADTPASGETGLSGEYKYCATFVNANGWEGAPGSLEEYETAVTLSAETAVVTVSWSDARIACAKIYRTIDHGADFYCVGEIHASGETFRDTTPDADAQLMNPLTTQYHYPPPDKGKYLCEYAGVFFLAVGDLLYFSAHGTPHAWPTTQFLSFDDEITGIAPEFQGVLVFTRNNVFRVTGAENPDTVAKTFIPGNQGCANHRSIAVLNNAPVWLSNDGICMWDGNSVAIPSHRVKNMKGAGVKCAATADDRYFLFLAGECVVFDRRNGDIFYKLAFSCDYAWYDGSLDCLFMQTRSGIFKYGTGAGVQTMRYTSPLIGGGGNAIRKFREFILSGDAESAVELSIDGEKAAAFSVGGGRRRVKLPRAAVGHGLSCRIVTRGVIRELAVLYD